VKSLQNRLLKMAQAWMQAAEDMEIVAEVRRRTKVEG
jgi:hypothetical protein